MDKVYRQIERRRAGHLKAWATLCKMLIHLQKHHSQVVRDPEVRDLVQAHAQLEVEAELWNEPARGSAKLPVLDCVSAEPVRKPPLRPVP